MCLIMAWSKCYVGNWNILQKNMDTAKASLEVLIADRQFLRDRVTISQVSGSSMLKLIILSKQVTVARVYNCDVHQQKI
ncbi:unnamed protein product [Trifolium pratense]|uniref:Uncharacterized protein n=1 Tax=Trifolium pratense TaxID=57577 RepID=A0ACB0KCI9_TRIPR|nr:unnamed protein product [Trifolium pratense]